MRAWMLAIGLLLVASGAARAAENGRSAAAPPRVTLELRQVPLREALKRLFEDASLKHGVDSAVPDVPVTLDVRDVSRETALRALLRSAAAQAPGITYEVTGDFYQVVKRVVTPKPPAVVTEEPGASKRVYLRLGGVNLREAFRKLVAGSLVRIHVHETVPDVPVSVETKGLTLPEAARAIVRDAAILIPGLAIRPQGGGYFVWIDDGKPGLAGLPGIMQLPGTDEHLAKIRVRYLEVTRDSWLVQYLQYALLERQLARQQQQDRMRAAPQADYRFLSPPLNTPDAPQPK